MWSTITVSSMLKNPVYVGDMAQGRNRVKSYKFHKLEPVPEEQWIVVQNTHEPIIDRETFAKAKDLLKRDTRTAPSKSNYIYSAVFSSLCRLRAGYVPDSQQDLYVYYQCGGLTKPVKKGLHYALHKKVPSWRRLPYTQSGSRCTLRVNYSAIIAQINAAPQKKSQSARLNEQISAKEKELARIMRYKQALYQDWKDGQHYP